VRANEQRPPGDALRRKALGTRLRALRRARKRVLAAIPGGDVADLDFAITRIEGMLADAGG
jgi:hypothetical protein